MNAIDSVDILERKILELRILTNANWKNQKYEMAVLGEKVLRSITLAKAYTDSSNSILEKLPKSMNELRDENKLLEILETQALENLSRQAVNPD
jgi:hypothetical protein